MKDMDYTVVQGAAPDIESIVQFQVDMAMESEGTALDRERVRRGVAAVMDDASKGTYLVAKTEGRAIGSLMLTREWSDWNGEWYWWIQSVYVVPEYRRQGVYSAMYAEVKRLAQDNHVSQIRLYVDKANLPAQRAYQQLGMQESHYLMFEENMRR